MLLVTGFLIMTVGCFLLYRMKILTLRASLAAGILGIYLLWLGWRWLVVVLAFFITSVLLTKLREQIRGKKMKSTSGRNEWQVLANILWAVISSVLYIIFDQEVYINLFIVFVAAVTADTWASEAGPLLNRHSFSVAQLKKVDAGTTGAISAGGTLAALAGAVGISAVSLWLFQAKIDVLLLSLLSISAFLACFADTFLGAFVENRLQAMPYFKNNTGHITPNDIVNLGGSLTAGLFFILLSHL